MRRELESIKLRQLCSSSLMSHPFSHTNTPQALKMVRRKSAPYSLSNPPRAPRKDQVGGLIGKVRSLQLPSTPPPPAPRKAMKARKKYNLRPIKLDWGTGAAKKNVQPITLDWGTAAAEIEAQHLASSGCVREKYLRITPLDISEEEDFTYLERLWELYFPASQPRNAYEEAYLSLMRSCIDERLGLLRNM